jgi:hypothetical protein
MKIYKVKNKEEVLGMLLKPGGWRPRGVFFLFSEIMGELKLEKPEPIMISWQGMHFMVPVNVVENAMAREATLAKHNEYYTKGDMFHPTVIELSQCEALSDEAVHMMSGVRFYPD